MAEFCGRLVDTYVRRAVKIVFEGDHERGSDGPKEGSGAQTGGCRYGGVAVSADGDDGAGDLSFSGGTDAVPEDAYAAVEFDDRLVIQSFIQSVSQSAS